MKYKYSSDLHSHSNCSPDGSNSIEEMCQKAMDIGLHYYAVTDHCECHDFDGAKSGYSYRKWSPESYQRLCENAERLHNKLRLLKGIELGQPMQNMEAAEEILTGRNYDFILGSVHNIKDFEDFYYLKYDDMPDGYVDELLSKYFGEVLEMAQWGKINSLAHLTYPLRYIKSGGEIVDIDLEPHESEIREIYEVIIKKDIAIEINCARIGMENGKFSPELPLVKIYKDMGGKLITLGSDAHQAADIGRGIDEAQDMIKQAGFSEFAIFEKGSPILLPIE